ncbi:MAG: hypothetical protein ACK5NN_11930, partial [Sphingomonadaceae bacterium]
FLFLNFTPAGLIIKHWDTLKPYFIALWEGIKALFSATFDWARYAFLNFTPHGLIIKHWASIAGWFSGLWQRIKSVFSGSWASIRAMMSGWAGAMMSIGRNIIDGLAAGIRAAPMAVWNALKGVVMGGVTQVKDWLGIKSPSRVFMGIGDDMMAGLAIGLDKAGAGPIGKLSGITRQLAMPVALGSAAIAMPAQGAAWAGRVQNTGAQGSSPGALADRIELNFHNVTARDAEDIARAVRRELERIERERASSRRADYKDDE